MPWGSSERAIHFSGVSREEAVLMVSLATLSLRPKGRHVCRSRHALGLGRRDQLFQLSPRSDSTTLVCDVRRSGTYSRSGSGDLVRCARNSIRGQQGRYGSAELLCERDQPVEFEQQCRQHDDRRDAPSRSIRRRTRSRNDLRRPGVWCFPPTGVGEPD